MKSSLSFAKVWFVVSFAGLAFLYGTAVGKWEWFPHSFLNRAVDQARRVIGGNGEKAHAGIGKAVYEREGARVRRPEKVQSGLTLITSSWRDSGESTLGLKLIGADGEVVHKWTVDAEGIFSAGSFSSMKDPSMTDIHGSYLLENGDVVVNLTYIGTVRLNSCGEVMWTLKEGGHHSVSQGEDGNFWVTAVSQEKKSSSSNYPDGFPGLTDPVWMDRVLHVSEDGKILDDIYVLDLIYKNNLERYFPKMGSWGPDITHQNDVEPLPERMAEEYPLFEAGDLVLSLHHIDLVLVFDPESKEVKWHSTVPFTRQHDPDFIGGGWIGIFDNNTDGRGGEMLGGSRVVGVQPHTDSVRVLFSGKHLDRFYTDVRGKWQLLGNGNMLLTEAEAGRAVEVSPEGELVWEWIHESYDSKVPSVTEATRYNLTKEEVASWSCSSVDSVSTSAQ